MNEVFLIGKVISEIEFKFIINSKHKKSVVKFMLKTEDRQKIKIIAYNEKADYIYQHIKQNDFITIEGKIRDNFIEIEEINFLQ